MTIVYIDDEPLLCRAFRSLLRKTDHEVHTFTDPAAAVTFLQVARVDLVVCDYRMPGLTGLEVLERLREDVPFVLVSGDLSVAEQVRHLPRVRAVLSKPFPMEDLAALVEKWMAQSKETVP